MSVTVESINVVDGSAPVMTTTTISNNTNITTPPRVSEEATISPVFFYIVNTLPLDLSLQVWYSVLKNNLEFVEVLQLIGFDEKLDALVERLIAESHITLTGHPNGKTTLSLSQLDGVLDVDDSQEFIKLVVFVSSKKIEIPVLKLSTKVINNYDAIFDELVCDFIDSAKSIDIIRSRVDDIVLRPELFNDDELCAKIRILQQVSTSQILTI
ncbi:unnamed protein product [Ambrosiozyma monospora]|uniref:Unnamed protein product n=1 Tax=Ambrosiozyma monospora TaxID=43982 RepID=A0ACB5T2N8_AMBMO|nr:unnamed protein product [Ambrosiozyma monospora]